MVSRTAWQRDGSFAQRDRVNDCGLVNKRSATLVATAGPELNDPSVRIGRSHQSRRNTGNRVGDRYRTTTLLTLKTRECYGCCRTIAIPRAVALLIDVPAIS